MKVHFRIFIHVRIVFSWYLLNGMNNSKTKPIIKDYPLLRDYIKCFDGFREGYGFVSSFESIMTLLKLSERHSCIVNLKFRKRNSRGKEYQLICHSQVGREDYHKAGEGFDRKDLVPAYCVNYPRRLSWSRMMIRVSS